MKGQQDITKLGYYLNRAFSGIVEEFDHALHEAGLPLNHARFLILKALEKNEYISLRPSIDSVIKKVTTEYCSGMTAEEIEGGLNFLHKILEKRIGNN